MRFLPCSKVTNFIVLFRFRIITWAYYNREIIRFLKPNTLFKFIAGMMLKLKGFLPFRLYCSCVLLFTYKLSQHGMAFIHITSKSVSQVNKKKFYFVLEDYFDPLVSIIENMTLDNSFVSKNYLLKCITRSTSLESFFINGFDATVLSFVLHFKSLYIYHIKQNLKK